MTEAWQQIFLGILVISVFVAFVKEWFAPEVVAIFSLFACVAVGILPIDSKSPFHALSVFGHPAPITVACMFIISEALERTGVIKGLGNWFEHVAAKNQLRMLVVLMLLGAFLSAFVNNTPVVVVFMPLVLALCRKKDWKASRFLIPLSYAAIVGGTVTIVGTSTNLLASGIAEDSGLKPFSLFEIAPLGLIFVATTFVYLLTIGRKLLPDRASLASLIDSTNPREFITHAFVSEDSPFTGQKLLDAGFIGKSGARVIEVRRDSRRLTESLREIVLQVGDEIVFKGGLERLMSVMNSEGVAVRGVDELGLKAVRQESAVLMEAIIGPQSSFVGKNLKELNFRQRYGAIILAVHRQGKNLREQFENVRLTVGDTLLVQGSSGKMQQLFLSRDFINLSEPKESTIRYNKAPLALLALIGFVVMGVLGEFGVIEKVPVVVLALGAALFTFLTRCLTPQEAYRAVEWKVVFLIFGMLGLGLAMQASGLAARIADSVVDLCGSDQPMLLLAAFYLLAAVMTEIISNNAVAALLTPLVIIVAHKIGVDPRPFVIAVMFGSSASFSTPIGYQTNTFVFGAGGYKFGDFFKVGFPLAFILWIIASFTIPLIWPF